MLTIILNKETGQYISETGWTTDRGLARDFRQLSDAASYRYKHEPAEDLQIICQPRDEPSEEDVTW